MKKQEIMMPKREDYKDGSVGLLAYSFSLEDCLRAAQKKVKEQKITIQRLKDEFEMIETLVPKPSNHELRIKKKRGFIYNNVALVAKCSKQDELKGCHKTDLGAELVNKAREELEYSYLTYNGDIYYGIIKEFRELEKEA